MPVPAINKKFLRALRIEGTFDLGSTLANAKAGGSAPPSAPTPFELATFVANPAGVAVKTAA